MRRPGPTRTLLIRSADGRDFLRLASIGRDSGYPSLEVRVEGTARGFSGGGDVWIDGFALKEFAAALRAFEQRRQGRVELHAMNPEELGLVLRSLDDAGHLLVEFTIARTALVGDRAEPVAVRVAGAFELDPGTLREILAGFGHLVDAVGG